MKKISFVHFVILSLFVYEFVVPNNVVACSRTTPVNLSITCKVAGFVIRAQAVKYSKEPENNFIRTTGIPDSKVEFKILEVIKGDSISGSIFLNGYLNDKDDFNDQQVPYNFVSLNGRSGSCFANTYKQGAEFLLFLKKTSDGFTVNIDSLAPVNEQLHSSVDPWVFYIKGLLKGLEETGKGKK